MEEEDCQSVDGIQDTLQTLFELGSYVMVVCFPRLDQFNTLAMVSYAVAVGAASLFTLFVCHDSLVGDDESMEEVRACMELNGGTARNGPHPTPPLCVCLYAVVWAGGSSRLLGGHSVAAAAAAAYQTHDPGGGP